MTAASFKHRFLENAVAGDIVDWSQLEQEIDRVLAGRSMTAPAEVREAIELDLMRAFASRLATYRAVEVKAVLDGRKQAETILRSIAAAEPAGGIGFSDLLVELKMKKANLSLQLDYLQDNDLVRRHRRGKNVIVQLSPTAHKFAINERWIDSPRIAMEDSGAVERPASMWSRK